MISKNEIKRIRSLHRKKGRSAEGLFLIEGVKGVQELLEAGWGYETIYQCEETFSPEAVKRVRLISQKEMGQLTALSSPSPVLAVAKIPSPTSWQPEKWLSQRVLVLDGIADPGNMGTILRTADWFGIRHVLAADHCVDLYNPKVVQATMGSLFRVNVYRGDLVELLGSLRSIDPAFPVFITAMEGKGLEPLREEECGALVIGSEAHGVSDAMLGMVGKQITIPGSAGAESLNAAIATSIVLYEWTR